MNGTRDFALALFLTYAIILKPRLPASIKAVLPVYQKHIRLLPGPLPRRLARVVLKNTGLDDGEPVFFGSEQEPDVKYPEVLWRDPRPNRKHGHLRRRVRLARHRSIAEEAAAQGLLPSELQELERGCNPRAGLTSCHGMEPLRAALLKWAARQQLTGNQHFRQYCLNWALEVLRYWPPPRGTDVLPIDQGLIMVPRPPVPRWRLLMQTWPEYVKSLAKDPALLKYRDDMLRLIDPIPAKRGPGKKQESSLERHFEWLAGHQLCGWSKHAIARAAGVRRQAVLYALHGLAKQIGLELRPETANDRDWTGVKIRTCLKSFPRPGGKISSRR
jgi:hypothetical protein